MMKKSRNRLFAVILLATAMLASKCFDIVQAFTSTAAPRFDTFCDNLVGSWKQVGDGVLLSGRKDDDNSKQMGLTVEEVMRRCGGAVQGVREVVVTNSHAEEELAYLNRANDGFVYFDDGSYSVGPTEIHAETMPASFFVSLSLGKTHRCLLGGRLDETSLLLEQETDILESYMGLVKTRAYEESLQDFLGTLSPCDDTIYRPDWTSRFRCRMSSSSQPWMLQRATYEMDNFAQDQSLFTKDASSLIKITDDKKDDPMQWKAYMTMLKDTEDNDTIVFQAGIFCVETGLGKACERTYHDNGQGRLSLSSVSMMLQTEPPF